MIWQKKVKYFVQTFHLHKATNVATICNCIYVDAVLYFAGNCSMIVQLSVAIANCKYITEDLQAQMLSVLQLLVICLDGLASGHSEGSLIF